MTVSRQMQCWRWTMGERVSVILWKGQVVVGVLFCTIQPEYEIYTSSIACGEGGVWLFTMQSGHHGNLSCNAITICDHNLHRQIPIISIWQVSINWFYFSFISYAMLSIGITYGDPWKKMYKLLYRYIEVYYRYCLSFSYRPAPFSPTSTVVGTRTSITGSRKMTTTPKMNCRTTMATTSHIMMTRRMTAIGVMMESLVAQTLSHYPPPRPEWEAGQANRLVLFFL